MPSTQYFEKVENGTRYRIYLYEFENDVAPMLVRSALDASDGVHGGRRARRTHRAHQQHYRCRFR